MNVDVSCGSGDDYSSPGAGCTLCGRLGGIPPTTYWVRVAEYLEPPNRSHRSGHSFLWKRPVAEWKCK